MNNTLALVTTPQQLQKLMRIISTLLVAGTSGSLASAQTVLPATVRTNSAILDRSRNRVSVPLQLARPPGEFRTLVKEGNRWMPATNALSHSGGGTNLEIEPNRVYFLMQSAPKPWPTSGRAVTNRLLASSLVLMGTRPSGSASSHAEIVSGNVVIRSVLEPVPWDSKQKAYQTVLKVGFDSANSAQALRQILPLEVQLFGSNVSLQPDAVTITQPNVNGYQTSTVTCVKYTTQAAVIAHYEGTDKATDESCPLEIEKLGILGMVNLLFPLPFLFATVIGGCTGGTLRLFKLRRKQRAEWYWLVPEGMLVGLVFVAALSAGIGSATGVLSPTVVGSEIGAFAIAALTGFLGTSALDYFTKNIVKL